VCKDNSPAVSSSGLSRGPTVRQSRLCKFATAAALVACFVSGNRVTLGPGHKAQDDSSMFRNWLSSSLLFHVNTAITFGPNPCLHTGCKPGRTQGAGAAFTRLFEALRFCLRTRPSCFRTIRLHNYNHESCTSEQTRNKFHGRSPCVKLELAPHRHRHHHRAHKHDAAQEKKGSAFADPSVPQLHPLVPPHVSHFRHVPFRTSVKFPHSRQSSPS
jgi:hypothetical protein